MTVTRSQPEDVGGGWFRVRDLWLTRRGRYCDRCETRIRVGDAYYTKQPCDPYKSMDYCEACYFENIGNQ